MLRWPRAALFLTVTLAAWGAGAAPAPEHEVLALQKKLPSTAPWPAAEHPRAVHTGEVLPRVTLELRDVDILQAAERISEATGLEIHVPPPQETANPYLPDVTARHTLPLVDFQQRRSLAWKNATLSTVLRDFSKAYRCHLTDGSEYGNLYERGVSGGGEPGGPTAQVEGYEVRINLINVEENGAWYGKDRLASDRVIRLEFAFRALNGDPLAVVGLGNVRLVDQNGRVAERWDSSDEDPAEEPKRWSELAYSPYPDEVSTYVAIRWPYPAPREFRAIEGDLILSRHAQRLHLEIVPPTRVGYTMAQKDGIFYYLVDSQLLSPRSFERSLQMVVPDSYPDLLCTDHPQWVSMLLADGRRILPQVDDWRHRTVEGHRRAYWAFCRAYHLSATPKLVVWEPGFRSERLRRAHFRMTSFPAHLDSFDGPARVIRPTPPKDPASPKNPASTKNLSPTKSPAPAKKPASAPRRKP